MLRISRRYLSRLSADDTAIELLRDKILDKALFNTHQFGWTLRALDTAIKELDLPPTSRGLFPALEFELVQHLYSRMHDRFMQDPQVSEWNKRTAKSTAEFYSNLSHVMKYRLKMQSEWMEHWGQVISLLTMRENLGGAARMLTTISEDLSVASGDRSYDFGWYSRRAGVSATYAATEIYLVEDMTHDYVASFEFMQRRIDELERLESASNQTYSIAALAINSAIGSLK
jgi:ubiquinone biosynthesis protein COQ9